MRTTIGLALTVALLAPPACAQQQTPRATGRVEARTITDSTFHRERRVWVYTPPGYAAAGHAPYDLLVVFDGGQNLEAIPLATILDTLLAGGHAPPFVAVLVDDSTGAVRLGELANRAPFAKFVAEQLVPWVRRGWNVTNDPQRTIVHGTSAGGLAAAYVAFVHPELFGNVLSLSGALWRGAEASNGPPFEWLTAQYAAAPKKDIRFVLNVGALETQRVMGGAGPAMIEANRRFRDALRARGYDVTYREVPEGRHLPESWALQLPAGIVTLTSDWKR